MLTSFGDNSQYVIDEVQENTDSEIVVLKEPRCSWSFQNVEDKNVLAFTPISPLSFIKGIYHLATARIIFVDNYHVVLAACNFRESTTCVQLWHANGAVKLFGLRDRTVQERRSSAQRRFREVYKRFHKIVVSSDEMADIFKEAFNKQDQHILKTGVPRTDFYFDKDKVSSTRKAVLEDMPYLYGKKVLLYAPTYRLNEMNMNNVHLDIQAMEKQLSHDYHLLIRVHPAVKLRSFEENSFVTNVSENYSIEDILSATDILISDYSSTPFEFSILKRPMLFYPFDLENYQDNTGIWFNYKEYVPGNIAMTTQTLIDMIKKEDYQFDKVSAFNEYWNKYADGNATKRLIKLLYNK